MADRPNPESLLASLQASERQGGEGQLKIYLGYAAGVGKTYAMLNAARGLRNQGIDIVIGYIESHGRAETDALTEGFERIAPKNINYQQVSLAEVDIQAVLQRAPKIVLIDELAHTNAPGSLHERRWQDVEDVLAAGIDVWTTLNVQHIDSINDVVAQITGVEVREKVPDHVLDRAAEIELIDLPPEELLNRLKAGKIYRSQRVGQALLGFFQRSNLTALRELSLRQVAGRVHREVESARRHAGSDAPWATQEKLLVCIGPSPSTARVIRTAKRLAEDLQANWIAASVELVGRPPTHPNPIIASHFRLAESLGAETTTVIGESVAEAIVDLARTKNVTKIVIGKSDEPRWKRWLFGNLVDDVLEKSQEIDVFVLRGIQEDVTLENRKSRPLSRNPIRYLWGLLSVGLACIVNELARLIHLFDSIPNTILIFLIAVIWTAYRHGRGPAFFASFLAVGFFDYFFVPPLGTLAVTDSQYLLTFAIMLGTSWLISTLADRLRLQVMASQEREKRTFELYDLGKSLSAVYGRTFLGQTLGKRLENITQTEVAVWIENGTPSEPVYGEKAAFLQDHSTAGLMAWVLERGQMAGAGTTTLPGSKAIFFPILGTDQTLGVVGLNAHPWSSGPPPELRSLIEACISRLAVSLERDALAIDAAQLRLETEKEQFRTSLLSSVSHDLRTPLAVIAGTASSIESIMHTAPDRARDLLHNITHEADRLHRLLENLLHITRLDNGKQNPESQWHVFEEILGNAMKRFPNLRSRHEIQLALEPEASLIYVDQLLLEQALINLLDNFDHHTPAGSTLWIRSRRLPATWELEIEDNGPGIPAGMEVKIFDKFVRGEEKSDASRGSGLGLAIVQAIVKTHQGSIHAMLPASGKGVRFLLRLPQPTSPPKVSLE